MASDPVRVLILGAHPDDAEFHAGGLIVGHRELGHTVRIVSVTNGASGHHKHTASELEAIRESEGRAVAEISGVEYSIWEFPDGRLQPTLEVREQIIREIRSFAPDLVLTHRVNDYHPDHRAVGQAVQDASFLVTVPLIAADVPALRRDPVVAYMTDFFTRPNPIRADVAIGIDSQFDRVVDMLACHRSQVFEWLPYNQRIDEVNLESDKQLDWLTQWYGRRASEVANRFRSALIDQYGPEAGAAVRHAEVYEISEYAGDLDPAGKQRLFPLLPPDSIG